MTIYFYFYQWRIIIFVEGVAPQGQGSKGNQTEECLWFTYPKIG